MMMHIIDHLRRYLAIQNKKLCSHYVDGVRRQAKGRMEDGSHCTFYRRGN